MADPITTWDDESIADLISDTMSDTNDMDVTFGDFARATVKALRKEGLLPSVEGAQAVLKAECDKLSELIAAKGYPDTSAQIWLGWGRNKVHVTTHSEYSKPVFKIEFIDPGEDAAVQIGKLRAAIESAPALVDPESYSPYFTWPQAEAAE